ncbi:MAG: amino acid transporter [archaeon]|nr:amino acid transporter [archaeon]
MGGTIVTIVKSCIGCGLLNMPITLQAFGIIPSIFVFIFVLGLNTLSISMLMKCKDTTQRYGYSMFARLCFGMTGTILMKIFIIVKSLGGCCVYLRTFGGVCGQIVSSFIQTDDSFYFQETFYVILIFLVLAPLMFMNDISGLKKFSFLGVVCIFIFVVCIFIKYFYKAFQLQSMLITKEMLFPIDMTDYPSLFQKLTSLINGYYFHMNVFPIYLPLHPRSSRNMVKATFISSVLVSLVYYLVGLAGFALYQKDLQSSILPNIRDDLQELFNKDGKTVVDIFIIFVTFVSMGTFFISALFAMPFVFFALKKNLINLISMIQKTLFEKKEVSEKEASSMVETRVVMESVSATSKFVITLISYMVVLFCTLKVNQIIIINSIAGSTAGNILIFLAPATFLVMLGTKGFCSFEKHAARFFLFFGGAILVFFFKFQVIDVFFPKKDL